MKLINTKKQEILIESLSASSASNAAVTIKSIKNQIIGNNQKKLIFLFLNFLPKLSELLKQTNDLKIKKEILIIFNSFCGFYHVLVIQQLIELEFIDFLVSGLSKGKDDENLLKVYCLKCLKSILCWNINFPLNFPVEVISGLLEETKDEQMFELSLFCFIKLHEIQPKQNYANDFLFQKILNFLKNSEINLNLKKVCLDGISLFCSFPEGDYCKIIENAEFRNLLTSTASSFSSYSPSFLNSITFPSLSLAAVACLVTIYKHYPLISNENDDIVKQLKNILVTKIMPVMSKLLTSSTSTNSNTHAVNSNDVIEIKKQVNFLLSYLTSDSEVLQKSASDVHLISKISTLLLSLDCNNNKKFKLIESCLVALSSCCSLREECRKEVLVDNSQGLKLLQYVVGILGDFNKLQQCINKECGTKKTVVYGQNVDEKVAGLLINNDLLNVYVGCCMLIRSLSRSVRNLRTFLVDAGVVLPLMKLFDLTIGEGVGEEVKKKVVELKTTSCATVCNLVLDFSPMKKTVLDNGGLEKLISLFSDSDLNLRLNAVWAIKNLLFQADSDVKQMVLEKLKFEMLFRLLNDGNTQIQEQALNLIRNLACGSEADIEKVFVGIGEKEFINLLEEKLQQHFNSDGNTNGTCLDIVLQALYVIVNICTGSEKHKKLVTSSNIILNSIYNFITHERADVRVASVWCIINLTWPEDIGADERISRLGSLGFVDVLRRFENDDELDVKERVRTALQHFQHHEDHEESSRRMNINE